VLAIAPRERLVTDLAERVRDLLLVVATVRHMHEELEDTDSTHEGTTHHGVLLPVSSGVNSVVGGCCLPRDNSPFAASETSEHMSGYNCRHGHLMDD